MNKSALLLHHASNLCIKTTSSKLTANCFLFVAKDKSLRDWPPNEQHQDSNERTRLSGDNLPSPEDDEGGFLQAPSRPRSRNLGSMTDMSGQTSKPSSVMDLNANTTDTPVPPPADTYNDFMRGLSRSNSGTMGGEGTPVIGPDQVPHYRPTSSMGNYQIHPIIPRAHPSHHVRRGRAYDSETGYRSDGYRSDQETYRYQTPKPPPREAGYSSDWEAVVRQNTSQQYSRRERGYASDHEVYSASRSQKFRPISVQPMYSTIPEQSQNRERQVGGNQNRQAPPSGGSQNRGASPAGYSNAPFSKRTTIRNDEMYEQNRSSSCNNSQPNTNRTRLEAANQIAGLPGSQAASANQSRTSLNNIKDNVGQGSTDDEVWKAQLYKASVKLQKTPSDKRKQKPQVCMCKNTLKVKLAAIHMYTCMHFGVSRFLTENIPEYAIFIHLTAIALLRLIIMIVCSNWLFAYDYYINIYFFKGITPLMNAF